MELSYRGFEWQCTRYCKCTIVEFKS